MISANEYASLKNIHITDVMEEIRSGKLNAYEIEGTWFINGVDSPTKNNSHQTPITATVMNYFAGFTLFAGFILIIFLITGDVRANFLGYGFTLMLAVACILQGTIFAIFGQVAFYLSKIEFNTRNNLQKN